MAEVTPQPLDRAKFDGSPYHMSYDAPKVQAVSCAPETRTSSDVNKNIQSMPRVVPVAQEASTTESTPLVPVQEKDLPVKQTKSRKPYRFCARCWTTNKVWVVKSITKPTGVNVSLHDHTKNTCPQWPFRHAPSIVQHRQYGAAFKKAGRGRQGTQHGILHDMAFKEFKLRLPQMSDADLHNYLLES